MKLSNWAVGFILVLSNSCTNSYSQGKSLYLKQCAQCHMDDGSGLAGLIPPLANADYLRLYPEKLPCIIRNGISGPISVNAKTYNQPMEAITNLNNVEIANILNYIQSEWGDANVFYSPDRIVELLNSCP